MTTHTIEYGTQSITFDVDHAARTTLDISVAPEGAVHVRAPYNTNIDTIAERVRRRGRWIVAQQRYFAQFAPRTPPRRWVPGETHLYLGRQRRLRIGNAEAATPRVRLTRGFFLYDGIAPDDADTLERLMRTWYRERAVVIFARRLEVNRDRFGRLLLDPVPIRLQVMRTRWASTSQRGLLTLNPTLVRAPVDGIDYVLTHELCHLLHADHGREFTELLAKVMPDWERRKLHLERTLA